MTTRLQNLFFSLLFFLPLQSPCAHSAEETAEPASQNPIARQLLDELNLLRAKPTGYIPVLEEYRKHFQDNRVVRPGEAILITHEGTSAVDEAIAFLREATPLPALRWSEGMGRAADDHVRDIGPRGSNGHFGTDGSSPTERLRRYGDPKSGVAENLGFGENDARRMLLLLLIDDGVPDRGHRKNMFDSRFRVTGIACGAHTTYGAMCVMDFAGDFKEKCQ